MKNLNLKKNGFSDCVNNHLIKEQLDSGANCNEITCSDNLSLKNQSDYNFGSSPVVNHLNSLDHIDGMDQSELKTPTNDYRLMVSDSDNDSLAESIYHQPPKAADRNAAYRLAKRLFHLDGFRITDVAKHLSKRYSIYLLKINSFLFCYLG